MHDVLRLYTPRSSTLGRSLVPWLWLCLLVAALCGGCETRVSSAQTSLDRDQAQRVSAFVDEIAERIGPYATAQLQQLRASSRIEQALSQGTAGLSILPGHVHALARLYADRSWTPIFTQNASLTPAGVAVAQAMIGADSQGLDPSDLHADGIRAAISTLMDHDRRPRVTGAFALLPHDRAALSDWLNAKISSDGALPDLQTTLERLTGSAGTSPVPGLTKMVQAQASSIEPVVEATTRLEVLLADGFLTWSISQRFHNLRYLTTDMANARRWRILVDGKPYSTRQPGSPYSEERPDAALLRDITGTQVAIVLAREYLQKTAESGAFNQALEAIEPPFEQYRRLVKAARRYRALVLTGGWSTLDGPVGLRYGDDGPAVAALKKRLAIEGYFDGDSTDTHFGSALRGALLIYQKTHQLTETTRLNEETLTSLNIPAIERLAQIHVTMGHWRNTRIGEDYDDQYILVNVPDFHAELWSAQKRIDRFPVVVGRTKHWRDKKGVMHVTGRTPLFSDLLQYIVFNPYWNVPPSIEPYYQKKIDADPFWLLDNGFEFIPTENGGRLLRQLPGPDNALGLVKFIFPNDHSVYMHDTNQPGLFNRPTREYSHGCIRVQHALNFSRLLLARDRGISKRGARKFVQEQLDTGTEQWVNLRDPIPVHIEYYVVRIDDDGHANFGADFHRIDKPLVAARVQWLQKHLRDAGRSSRSPLAANETHDEVL